MRDSRFVAVHRGGSLTRDNHRKLMRWARECSEHVLSLLEGSLDERLAHALYVAREWENENIAVGAAMQAAVGAHAAARESSNPVTTALARSIGQTVATAHMADHSMGGALYALKALKLAGQSIAQEREWQERQLKKLPPEIVELVLAVMLQKGKSLKLW
jgi:hypothetical protein